MYSHPSFPSSSAPTPNVTLSRPNLALQATVHVSSAKTQTVGSKYGVHNLFDGNPETFWQSDGDNINTQSIHGGGGGSGAGSNGASGGGPPHIITLDWGMNKVSISEIVLDLSFTKDESYTPSGISVGIGINLDCIEEIGSFVVMEPEGKVRLRLAAPLKMLKKNGRRGESKKMTGRLRERDMDMRHGKHPASSNSMEEMGLDQIDMEIDNYESIGEQGLSDPALDNSDSESDLDEDDESLEDIENPSQSGTVTPSDSSFNGAIGFVRTHVLEIRITGNHQGGRDTQIRGLEVFGPRGPRARKERNDEEIHGSRLFNRSKMSMEEHLGSLGSGCPSAPYKRRDGSYSGHQGGLNYTPDDLPDRPNIRPDMNYDTGMHTPLHDIPLHTPLPGNMNPPNMNYNTPLPAGNLHRTRFQTPAMLQFSVLR